MGAGVDNRMARTCGSQPSNSRSTSCVLARSLHDSPLQPREERAIGSRHWATSNVQSWTHLGLERNGCVAILGAGRLEAALADLGILMAGGITLPLAATDARVSA